MHVLGASINYHNSFCGDLAFRINDLFQFCRVSALVDTQVCVFIYTPLQMTVLQHLASGSYHTQVLGQLSSTYRYIAHP